jgi:formylglycine-generating enzyme required for sulfatase activity
MRLRTAFSLFVCTLLVLNSYGFFKLDGNQGVVVSASGTLQPTMLSIPGGVFAMGDHYGYVDPSHPSDEIPIHDVAISPFKMGQNDITVEQYCLYLNSALSSGNIKVVSGLVYLVEGSDVLFQTRQADQYSRIDWNGSAFSVLDNKADHPITSVMWCGAAAFSNWLSVSQGLQPCYNTASWECDFAKNGYRLPTEAEWEYAARGGQYNPYHNYTYGNLLDKTKSNIPNSGDPYEGGALPWTTPVGFYNGQLQLKSALNWPGNLSSYQTSNGANDYGLYDMAGNVWQWCNDWYGQNYYNTSSNYNPTGPANGTLMLDGKPYRVLRGGNWYNGDDGHSRVSNRDPAYYRGPLDPNHPYYHVGFRVVQRDGNSLSMAGQTVGLFVNTASAWQGYTLLAPKHFTSTYLINNQGQIVHSWNRSKYEPGQSAYLLENGNLMRAAMTKGPLSTGGGEGGRIEEYDWNGTLVWEFDYSTEMFMSHHDFRPLPNGNVLVLAVEKKTYDQAIAAGFDPSKLTSDIKSQGFMLPDSVVEVKPTRPVGGIVVWEWHVWDHLVQDFNASKANYGNVASHPELIDADGTGNQIPLFWNHMNSINYNAELGQIILSVRGNSEIWVIDHNTTSAEASGHSEGRSGKGGDLLYRWGNPLAYKAGGVNSQMLFQQHDAQWIASDCPGAGNILVFNNGLGRSYSSVDEFNPPTVDSNGNYPLVLGAAFGPANLTWTYKESPPNTLYSEAISGAQRLPNGNTLICDGVHGVLTEVTASGEIVWKYVNPVVKEGPLGQGSTPALDDRGHQMNAVFRAERYSMDYVGLQSRDLAPQGTLEVYSSPTPTPSPSPSSNPLPSPSPTPTVNQVTAPNSAMPTNTPAPTHTSTPTSTANPATTPNSTVPINTPTPTLPSITPTSKPSMTPSVTPTQSSEPQTKQNLLVLYGAIFSVTLIAIVIILLKQRRR